MSDPTDRPTAASITGADLMRQFLPTSPYVAHLGMRLVNLEPGLATLTMPFNEHLITIGTMIHGGAIASLIDSTAMVAAWSDAEVPANQRGTPIGLTVSYLAVGGGEVGDGKARVLRRGRSLVYLDVDVLTASGAAVAKGLVTYKIG